MSFGSMAKEMQGDVPGISLPYAQTLLNRALEAIYGEQRWSFQVAQGGWLTSNLVSAGTITVQPFAVTLTGDAAASLAWGALVGRPLLTEMQIRVPGGVPYSVVAVDTASAAPLITLILDRPWMEPAQLNAAYLMYQVYFPVPVRSFKKFGTIRDVQGNAWVDYKRLDQAWLSRHDPQRMVFGPPTSAVPFQVDTRPGSATPGSMLYELWPHSFQRQPFAFSYLWAGPQLSSPSDFPPYPIGEEMVLWRAKEMGFLWKESQRGDGMERGSGADWRFLTQEAHEQYVFRLKEAKLIDVELGDLYFERFERTAHYDDNYVSPYAQMNVGTL